MFDYVTIDQYNKDMKSITDALTKVANSIEKTAKILENHEDTLQALNSQSAANAIMSIDLIESILNVLVDKNLLTLDEKTIIINRAIDARTESLNDTKEESND